MRKDDPIILEIAFNQMIECNLCSSWIYWQRSELSQNSSDKIKWIIYIDHEYHKTENVIERRVWYSAYPPKAASSKTRSQRWQLASLHWRLPKVKTKVQISQCTPSAPPIFDRAECYLNAYLEKMKSMNQRMINFNQCTQHYDLHAHGLRLKKTTEYVCNACV